MSSTIQVEVLYFHILRERTGRERDRIELQSGQRISALLKQLYAKYPQIMCHDRSLMIAVNEEFARRGRILEDGDEVALLPPVSGG